MKQLLKYVFRIFGLKIKRIKKKSNEILNKEHNYRDAYTMQKFLLKNTNKQLTIFDIGAYDGETALRYNTLFPKSNIYSFEPFTESFENLVNNVKQQNNIKAINKAIANKVGMSCFNSNSFAPTNSLLETDEVGERIWGKGLMDTVETINVELTTIDEFVELNNIEKIDILKMDVQGAEFLVLEGAKKSIDKGIINLIYTEIMTIPCYKNQKEFDEILKLFRIYGYSLYNLYNFSLAKNGLLRNVDAIFLKDKNNDF